MQRKGVYQDMYKYMYNLHKWNTCAVTAYEYVNGLEHNLLLVYIIK
jgi:hypothetical protein